MTLQSREGSRQEKAISLFSYLKELTELRSKSIRDFERYERVLWLTEIPSHPSVSSSFDLIRDGASNAENWLELRKPRPLSEAPPLPSQLQRWISSEDVRDSSRSSLSLLERVPAVESPDLDSQVEADAYEFAADQPELQILLDRYLTQKWLPWAERDRLERKIKATYEVLFSMYQMQQRAGEQFEIVLGFGLLSWRPTEGEGVRRHLVTVPAGVAFEPSTGALSVVPGPDDPILSLEQDMLDPEYRVDPKEETRVRELLSEAGDSIWDRSSVSAALTAWVNAVSANGRFQEERLSNSRPTSSPVVQFAPALILRKRSDRSLVRFLTEAIEQIQSDGAVPEGILDLIELSDEALFDDDLLEAHSKPFEGGQQIYFPLEANDEQLEILHRLEQQHGVLVQGPPGTGKSHTIANLICHLLATGQRVLVTSHTPRALRVLRDKIPEEVRSLCVSLVGTDRTAIEEVENSVLGITRRYDHYEIGRQRSLIRDLEQSLDLQRRENAVVTSDLRALRERETYRHVIGAGNYEGTAQQIAQRLAEEDLRLGWIPDSISLGAEPPLTDREAVNLLRVLRDLDSARIEVVSTLSLSSEDLPYPEEFDELVAHECRARERSLDLADARAHPNYQRLLQLEDAQRTELRYEIANLRDRFAILRDHSTETVSRFFEAIDAGQYRALRQLHADTVEALSELDSAASIAHVTVVGVDQLDKGTLQRDATALLAHLRSGGGRGTFARRPRVVKETDYLGRSVFIDGRPCNEIVTLEQLLLWLSTINRLEAIRARWEPFESIGPSSISRQIEELRDLSETLSDVLSLCDRNDWLFRTWGSFVGSGMASWETDRNLLDVQRLFDAIGAEEQLALATTALGRATTEATAHPSLHPLHVALIESIYQRSPEKYRHLFSEIRRCDDDRMLLEVRDQIFERMQQAAPNLLGELQASPHDSSWDARLPEFQQAWQHAQASTWLQEFEQPGRLEQLRKQLDTGVKKERSALQQLSAELAWLHFFSRMTQAQSQHLRAWSLAVRKIGKGTGKHAATHRRHAREHMEYCRPAIPAWIMPIYRVTETMRPNSDRFDVVIIDEASQSGPEALFLQYIAKKIIVVGDDKQISPELFTDQASVDLLRRRNIADLPFGETFGVSNSFFDQAVIRYSGRVQLREHFRCMPEIIQFSNNLSYANSPLIPLRQYGVDRLEPVLTTHVQDGYESTSGTNEPEAETLVRQIVACCADPRYHGKTMGIISLLGTRQQESIRKRLFDALSPEEIDRRRLDCGGPYDFQGDERDVIFLSLVVAPTKEGSRAKPAQTGEPAKRRFNVAASRARDQLWLFHSVTLNDLPNPDDVRRKLLEYCLSPHVESMAFELPEDAGEELIPPFESKFEQQVYAHIRRRGYRVLPQVEVGSYRIDLVVEGLQGRMAVECDGDRWHGPERYDYDIGRQRQLERAGWTFWRVSGSDFYRNPEQALMSLWEQLERLGIHPDIQRSQASLPAANWDAQPNSREETEEIVFEPTHLLSGAALGDNPLETTAYEEQVTARDDVSPVLAEELLDDATQVELPGTANGRKQGEVIPVAMPIFSTEESDFRSKQEEWVEIEEIISMPTQTRFEIEIDEILTDLDEKAVYVAETTQLERYAEIATSFMIPYQHWKTHTLAEPFDLPSRELIENLVEIIEAEGPVLCRRAFDLYASAAGFESERPIRSVLNSALYIAYSQRRIEHADEWEKPGQIDDILRIPGRSRVRLREGGGRKVDELPPSEVTELIRIVAEECGVDDRQEHYPIFGGVLAAYGIDVTPSDKRRAALWEVVKRRLGKK